MTWEEKFPKLFWFPHLLQFVHTFCDPADDEQPYEDIAVEYISA